MYDESVGFRTVRIELGGARPIRNTGEKINIQRFLGNFTKWIVANGRGELFSSAQYDGNLAGETLGDLSGDAGRNAFGDGGRGAEHNVPALDVGSDIAATGL